MSAIEEVPDSDPRPPLDDAAFDDPGAWGFCEYCAFSVGVKDGLRLPHRLIKFGGGKDSCRGGGGPPVEPQPVEAFPLKLVKLKKDPTRARQRQYHQRLRFVARARAREERMNMEAAREAARARFNAATRPTKVELLDQHGEVIADITDSVTSVRLEEDCGE